MCWSRWGRVCRHSGILARPIALVCCRGGCVFTPIAIAVRLGCESDLRFVIVSDALLDLMYRTLLVCSEGLQTNRQISFILQYVRSFCSM